MPFRNTRLEVHWSRLERMGWEGSVAEALNERRGDSLKEECDEFESMEGTGASGKVAIGDS